MVGLLEDECGLTRDSVVADVGSGTGNLSRPFLENGNRVFGVEPNAEMREAGERLLAGYGERFVSVDATAEDTRLPNASVGFVVAGQAFHWFDRGRAREEFGRILEPGGWVALAWNEQRTEATPFLAGYEALIRFYKTEDYVSFDEREVPAFFAPSDHRTASFEVRQSFDLNGLKGRLLSSSYIPEPGHPDHRPMLDELEALFREYQEDGTITIEYDTRVYYGRLG